MPKAQSKQYTTAYGATCLDLHNGSQVVLSKAKDKLMIVDNEGYSTNFSVEDTQALTAFLLSNVKLKD